MRDSMNGYGHYLINTTQAAKVLGTTTTTVRRLLKEGRVRPANTPVPGQKFFAKFDPREIDMLRETWHPAKPTLATMARKAPEALQGGPAPSPGGKALLARLDAVEAKLDRLLAIWE